VSAVCHLGIIPDGGRRWAQIHHVDLTTSYRLSMKRLCQLAEYGFANGLQELSIYLLSKANLKRAASEIDAIGVAICELLAMLGKLDIRVAIAGDLSLVSVELQQALQYVSASAVTGHSVNLCIAYDPLDELHHASSQAGGGELFPHLWVKTPIDLVIRTGDAQSLSNFLPLQCAYARIVFRHELFNDVSVDELLDDVHNHQSRSFLYGE
jgi:undecaprenyl diphosphate synthase